MLEGLEISEVNVTTVFEQTASARLDSEFYKKSYLDDQKKFVSNNSKKLVTISEKIDVGFVGAMVAHYSDEGVPLLQTSNVDYFFISNQKTIKIMESFHAELKKSQVVYEDILIARSGSFGKAAIYLDKEIINSSDIIIIKANKKIINPYFLTTFLNSSLGISQMLRFASGGLQGHINLTILEELQVPIMSVKFQNLIENYLKTSFQKLQTSKDRYRLAEKILLDSVKLTNFSAIIEKINIKSFKESFVKIGRLDAEYYQPKYENLIEHISASPHCKLIDLVKIKKSIEPGSDVYSDDKDGLPFLRVADYDKFGIKAPQKKLMLPFVEENLEKINALKPKKYTILFSKDGSVGQAYCLREHGEFITSGAILHLKIKDKEKILPDYLTLVLNSSLVQMQAERDVGGSIILHWRTSEIEQVLIPVIDMKKQKGIVALVQQSFVLKAESQRLLEAAKRAVEIAIERDEAAAMEFLAQQTHDCLLETVAE